MRKQVLTIVVIAVITAFIFACAAKAPVMQDGKQVGIFVLSDRGIKTGIKDDERNDRNEMGQFMEEDLINSLKHEGYNATLIQTQGQYVQASSNYLIAIRITDLRLVGRGARSWAGFTAGPTILKNHYEISGGSRLSMSFDDEDSTTQDWTRSPRELNERLIRKINDKLNPRR